MISVPVIAIFDIGKTNKKFFLIDTSYRIVLEKSVAFPEIIDEDDDACEDVKRLTKWIQKTLETALKDIKYNIKAVNFSAYGASLVYVDSKGKVVAPLYNYLKKYPRKLQSAF